MACDGVEVKGARGRRKRIRGGGDACGEVQASRLAPNQAAKPPEESFSALLGGGPTRFLQGLEYFDSVCSSTVYGALDRQ